MSQDTKAVGAVGMIRIGTFEITIAPLEQAEEMALDRALLNAATKEAGDHYTRCKPVLDAAKDVPGDRLAILQEIARGAMRREPLSPAAVYQYRTSPAGVALELYTRGKRATSGLTLAAVEAVVTEVNADALFVELLELIEGGDPKPTR